jgi:hypothetical protein
MGVGFGVEYDVTKFIVCKTISGLAMDDKEYIKQGRRGAVSFEVKAVIQAQNSGCFVLPSSYLVDCRFQHGSKAVQVDNECKSESIAPRLFIPNGCRYPLHSSGSTQTIKYLATKPHVAEGGSDGPLIKDVRDETWSEMKSRKFAARVKHSGIRGGSEIGEMRAMVRTRWPRKMELTKRYSAGN